MTSGTHINPYRCYYTQSHLYESNQVAIPFFEFHIVVPPIILLYYHINDNRILTHFIPCYHSSHSLHSNALQNQQFLSHHFISLKSHSYDRNSTSTLLDPLSFHDANQILIIVFSSQTIWKVV